MYKFIGLFILIFGFVTSVAQTTEQLIEAKAKAILPKLIDWRRHIHQNPELSNREFKTMEYVAAHLRKLGLEVKTGVAKTGVVALLKGSKPGPVVALRADMDALPVLERTDIPFKSTVVAEYLGKQTPVMHACGHDAHTAILMATAEVLTSMKKQLAGTVKFIFQPAEEGAPAGEDGGAELMVKENVMVNPKVDVIFGLHMAASLEAGKISYTKGAALSSADFFTLKIKGKAAHGSTPWLAVDPVIVSMQIINAWQTIVSRNEDLTKSPVVISVGKINGGVRENIIPEEVLIGGTIRTLDGAIQKDVHARMQLIVKNIAEANAAEAELIIKSRTLVTYNDPQLTDVMLPSLFSAAGKEQVIAEPWKMNSEDFSYYGEHAPALFIGLGGMTKGADPKKIADHHTPDFFIDDSQLHIGVKAFCYMVMAFGKLK
ncbi:MAG: amidohydrolase [Chitinophagaceae bacterium]|nr:amidohydrolase [Chitinophagaceae bacterium]